MIQGATPAHAHVLAPWILPAVADSVRLDQARRRWKAPASSTGPAAGLRRARANRHRAVVDLANVLRRQEGILHRRQALALAVPSYVVEGRIRGGRWQRVLPEVYATFTGQPSERQWRIAALLLAAAGDIDEDRAMLGGPSALVAHGLTPPVIRAFAPGTVHLLASHARRVRPVARVAIRRTTRMPSAWVRDGLPVAPAARAVIDTCRLLDDLRSVRALVAQAVQTGRTTTAHLAGELAAGESAGSRLTRTALGEVGAGARSAPEAALLTAVRRKGLPDPLWNTDMYSAAGQWLARPDAWWPKANTVLEIDSVEWHLAPERWTRTLERHELMTTFGLLVIHATPARVYGDLAGLLDRLAETIEVGRRTPPARVRRSTELGAGPANRHDPGSDRGLVDPCRSLDHGRREQSTGEGE